MNEYGHLQNIIDGCGDDVWSFHQVIGNKYLVYSDTMKSYMYVMYEQIRTQKKCLI
ncbi:MAG: hypothetical protein J6T10_26210 [Methanobrevibacter sp.]|nr:hypothetical protein [Methanobrevibacter sp.]